MKKKVMFFLPIILLIISSILYIFSSNNNNEIVSNKKEIVNNSFLTLMLEQEDGTYLESTSNTWPEGNYVFNSTLSRCENGGELEFDRETNRVILYNNKSDACYVYFDLYNLVEISNVVANTTYNSITLTVTTSGGENPVDRYYFSIDGGLSYEESNTSSYTFNNLTENHEYEIKVYVKDTAGYDSNEYSLTATTDAYVNPRVNSVTVTNTTTNSITVSVNASGGTNSISRYYYSSNGGSSYANTTSNTYTFTNLSPGQTYNIRVYVVDTNGIQSNVYPLSVQTDDGVLLADYIKGLYTSQGANGIYYHTSSLANGAGDNSYRYSGANPNNYVCFGSDASTCPSDNLYRIIGVFEDEVKLIKADYTTTSQTGSGGAYYGAYSSSTSYYKGDMNTSNIATYYWNLSGSNTWSSISLTTTNLNTTFLNSFEDNTWKDKIVSHTWKVGGMTYQNGYSSNAKTAYNYEVGSNSSSTIWSGKIGLMYVSDYYYGASPTYWTYPGYTSSSYPDSNGNYGSSYDYRAATGSNWMYMGLNEWTISNYSSSTAGASGVGYSGTVINYFANTSFAVRPSFYLNSNVTYVSGTGTESDPFRIA